jgi:hypothetical protein
MGKPYSLDLRERVVAAIDGGLSRNQAAKQFGIGISTEDRQRCAGPDGRSQAEGDLRRASDLAIATDQGWRLHLARARFRTR